MVAKKQPKADLDRIYETRFSTTHTVTGIKIRSGNSYDMSHMTHKVFQHGFPKDIIKTGNLRICDF